MGSSSQIRSAVALSQDHFAMLQSASLYLEVRGADGMSRQVPVDADGFLIGRGDFCDLRVDDPAVPMVHSEIHLQHGAMWIEAVDAASIEMNGRTVPRLSLRSGDTLRIGSQSITFRVDQGTLSQSLPSEPWEDLSALSALELCERIELEEQAVLEDERQQFRGIESLLSALENVLRSDSSFADQDPRTENVVHQLHELSEALAERTRQLQEQEQQFLASASDIKQSQDDMTRRMEVLLEQLNASDLRASA